MASILRISKFLFSVADCTIISYPANTVETLVIATTRKCFSTNNLARRRLEGDRVRGDNVELNKSANDYISGILAKKIIPQSRALKDALSQLACAGKLSRIEEVKDSLPDILKQRAHYEKYVCIASVLCGKGKEYFSKLEHQINEAKSSDVETLSDSYPRGASSLILTHHPELQQRFEDMARTYAVRHIIFPINDLWAYLFASGAESQAGELWSEFLEQKSAVMIAHVADVSYTKGDVDLAQRLLNQLRSSEKATWVVGGAYLNLIDIYVAMERSEEALNVVDEAFKNIPSENLVRGPLMRLRKLLEKQNQTLPEYVTKEIDQYFANKKAMRMQAKAEAKKVSQLRSIASN